MSKILLSNLFKHCKLPFIAWPKLAVLSFIPVLGAEFSDIIGLNIYSSRQCFVIGSQKRVISFRKSIITLQAPSWISSERSTSTPSDKNQSLWRSTVKLSVEGSEAGPTDPGT